MSFARVYWADGASIGRKCFRHPPNNNFIPGPQALSVAVTSKYIFWLGPSNDGMVICRANLDGTDIRPNLVKTGAVITSLLAANEHFVFWGDPKGTPPGGRVTSYIGAATLDGKNVMSDFLTLSDSVILGLAADRDYIFWTTDGPGATQCVGSSTITRSSNPKLITGPSLGPGIAINGRHIFFADGDGISRASRDGTDIVRGIVKGVSPVVLAADIGHVYWYDNNSPSGPISRANFDGTGVEIQFVPEVNRLYGLAVAAIEYVFVLMLENRSFDHMLGGLNIEGVDAVTGNPTKVNGVDRETVNYLDGAQPFLAHSPAPEPMPADPSHEYVDTMSQLATKKFNYDGKSGSVVNGGFVDAYNEVLKNNRVKSSPGDVMANCDKSQIPVLYSLATEFAVCDNWYGSVPGGTVPNRLFAMAGSSSGIDFQPSNLQMLVWETGGGVLLHGLQLQNGSIFDRLSGNGYKYEVFIDGIPRSVPGGFPMAGILYGVSAIPADVSSHVLPCLVSKLGNPYIDYPNAFSWIEPNYGFNFRGGQSQHPCDYLVDGEELIATVYNALRNSKIWEKSVLIITYDEHGGFFDHVVPPPATPPGDTPKMKSQFGCKFDQCGPRVPAVIVSPFIAKNSIDHSVYDHSSILKGTEDVLGLQPLTDRDRYALSPSAAFSLGAPRTDCPTSLEANKKTAIANDADTRSDDEPLPPPGILDVMLYVAAKAEVELAGNDESKKRDAVTRVEAVRTIGEARSYLEAVAAKINTKDGQP